MVRKSNPLFFIVTFMVFISGCASDGYIPGDGDKKRMPKVIDTGTPLPGSRYSMHEDAHPEDDIDVRDISNAVPRYEPYSRRGNPRSYKVFGKTYNVLDTHVGYSDTGFASWYGKKFHGHETSNGEIYDMYKMTAAHKNLPIPSYVKVENLENNKEVIVRVNDRGPFHSGRIIDLSYAAAKKLGYKDNGTAKVRVTAIKVDDRAPRVKRQEVRPTKKKVIKKERAVAKAPSTSEGVFVQMGAFRERKHAMTFAEKVENRTSIAPQVLNNTIRSRPMYRVLSGPFDKRSSAYSYIEMLKQHGYSDAFISIE